jgi:uncharacterized surface protein with fasciclin (FAS1) repeats
MKLKNRFIRMAAAFAIVGIVALQIPARPSVSLAADSYVDSGGGLLSGAGGVAAGAVIVGAAYGAIVNAGKATAGGTIRGGATPGAAAPIYDVTDGREEFSEIAKIIRIAGAVEPYRTETYTVFWPTNETLNKTVGASRVTSLQQVANSAQAKTFLSSITVAGSYNLQRLQDAAGQGKRLSTLTGATITLKSDGEKLTANGIELQETEYPASNGWILTADGIVAQDE